MFRRPRPLAALTVAAVAIFAAGCGGTDDGTPVACLEGHVLLATSIAIAHWFIATNHYALSFAIWGSAKSSAL